jgi:hypothetical protein
MVIIVCSGCLGEVGLDPGTRSLLPTAELLYRSRQDPGYHLYLPMLGLWGGAGKDLGSLLSVLSEVIVIINRIEPHCGRDWERNLMPTA